MAGRIPQRKVRLFVIYGGRSAEHEVSCISALHVVRAADPDRYDLKVIGITTDGRWTDATPAILEGGTGGQIALPSPDTLAGRGSLEPVRALTPADDAGPLVVLPLLHGPMGEDGTVQGLLEVAGVPYCGTGVTGSAAAMDKAMAKTLFAAAGLPQPRFLFVREKDIDTDPGAVTRRVADELGWPVFVKPVNLGSSIGISCVHAPAELPSALTTARRYDEFVIIEEAVSGARELEIGVLGWPDLRTSLPGEIKPSHEFYDFEDKYLDGAAALDVPACIPDDVANEMSRLAIEACNALRVDSMARVDFFWQEGGRGLLLNEVNTIPGFTPISMFPQLWAASGVPYEDLVDELVDQALRRADRRKRFETHR
ncbi:MAG TPA: D-alanine--D-alanine ligase family protein [Acidimicrobiales bacterium]|nr:D-alanine--D-alanine ligase family protein [Acidimicrobiales bacterium]